MCPNLLPLCSCPWFSHPGCWRDGNRSRHKLDRLKNGVLNLGNDRFDAALEQLNRGLALNQTHPLISNYVRGVIATICGLEGTR
jgi:hypothetical protein